MFIPFQEANSIQRPAKFTFPFYYSPHPIALKAVELLQDRLKTENFHHDFGIGLDAALNVEEITVEVIEKFINDFNNGTLKLDKTAYSFKHGFDED